jgi:signal transduction histidine kinase
MGHDLDRALAELRTSLSELRELARGIHPAVLSEKGLDSRAPVPVTLDSDGNGNGRLPEPVEVAAYFVVSEAITNVAKYAGATEANIADRVAALDGTLTVESPPDHGTHVHVEIPWGSDRGAG